MSVPARSAASRTVVERRATDVLVLGNSAAASAAAYSLARQGKKVVLVPRLHSGGYQAAREALRPLHLPSDDAVTAMTALEAAAYWRGLERVADRPFIQACGSLDLGLTRGVSMAASSLARVVDATKEAGVKFDLLRTDELAERVPQMKLPNSSGGLLQAEGGVLNSIAVEGALKELARRQGVLIRDQLTLQGWKDEDGHFAFRASRVISPDAESVLEAEQVLLCPGVDDWVHGWNDLFGLESSLQVKQVMVARCPAPSSCTATPLWRFLGGDYAPEQDVEAEPVLGAWGYPLQLQASRIKVAQAPGKGVVLQAQDSEREVSRRTVTQLQGLTHSLLKGADGDVAADAAASTHVCTSDGLPVLAFHPGFEEGRMLVATCTSGGSFGGCDGYQFSPLLAKAACNLLLGAGTDIPSPERWSGSRDGVDLVAVSQKQDTWMDLRASQNRPADQPDEETSADDTEEDKQVAPKKYWMS